MTHTFGLLLNFILVSISNIHLNDNCMEGANIFVLRLNVLRTQVTITARCLPGFTLANSSHLIAHTLKCYKIKAETFFFFFYQAVNKVSTQESVGIELCLEPASSGH